MQFPRAHDLIWLHDKMDLEGINEPWVANDWQLSSPVVVRRDSSKEGLIPVGVRGKNRSQRAAGWININNIDVLVSPEELISTSRLLVSPFVSSLPIQSLIQLTKQPWNWSWGVTGSVGYALATNEEVIHAESDLDLLIRSSQPINAQSAMEWQMFTSQLACRVDTQVETPQGAFALTEWLQGRGVLLKTNNGPVLVNDPWEYKESR